MEEIVEYLRVNWFANSYARMITSVAILVLTVLFKMLFTRLFNRYINHSTGVVKNDPTNYTFLKHFISALIYVVGISLAVYVVPSFRSIANSMLAGAGILALAISFASQQALSNIVSGIFIIMFKPFRVGDRIQVNELMTGMVEDITLRHTVIRNYESRRIIIPNSIISQESVINSDIIDERICKIFELGIGYGSDIKLARKIIQEEAEKHPNFIDNRSDEQLEAGEDAVIVRVVSWGDFSINLRIWVWADDAPKAFIMCCDLHESIKERFEKEGVEIPFPYQNVIHHNKKD